MDFCLKPHWHWQLGTLHNANRQGRKALEEKHGRWKYCAEVPVAWNGACSLKEKLCFPQSKLGNRKEEWCPQPLTFGLWCKLAVWRLTGRWSRPDDPRVFLLLVACLGASLFPARGFSVPRASDQHAHPLKRSGRERVPELPPPCRRWASQPSPSLVQPLRQKVGISHSSMQIRAAETSSSAPLETCVNAHWVRVPGGFGCSNKECNACFFSRGSGVNEVTALLLCQAGECQGRYNGSIS